MGYNLHITRRENRLETGLDITQDEFSNLIDQDPEFTMLSETGGKVAIWRSSRSELTGLLWWSDGVIAAKNPESELVNKLVNIAQSFDAKVQGDDGEFYTQ